MSLAWTKSRVCRNPGAMLVKTLYQVAVCCVILATFTASSRGDEFITDQHYDDYDPNGIFAMYAVGYFTPGATFTPALSSLDFVDLITQSQGAPFANLQVRILRDSSVLAYSDLLHVTNAVPATNRFRFYPSVALSPGTNYVIQLRTLDNWWTALRMGSLFFREGQVIPAQIPPPISIHVSYMDVCWSSRTNTTYQVQYRSDLTTNVWVDLGQPIDGNGLLNCVTDPVSGPQKFYRVKVLQ